MLWLTEPSLASTRCRETWRIWFRFFLQALIIAHQPGMVWVEEWPNVRVPMAANGKKKSWIFFGLLEAKLEQVRACGGLKLVQWC